MPTLLIGNWRESSLDWTSAMGLCVVVTIEFLL
jgi:hypothetical protein